MSDPILVVSPPAPGTPEIGQPTVQETTPASPADETHPAVQRINGEKAQLKQELDAAKAKIQELETSQLPEEDQIEVEYRNMYTEKILNEIPAEDFAKLPPLMQRQLKENPWSFTPQEDIDSGTRFAEDARSYYAEAYKVAKANIQELIEQAKGGNPEQPAQPGTKDPSIQSGGGGGEPLPAYTEGQLRVMAWREPEKYAQVMNAARSQK